MSEVNFGDILYDVQRACNKYSLSGLASSDLLQAATQIYIEERKLEESRKAIKEKEE